VKSCEFEYASAAEYEPEHHYTHTVACEQTPEQIGSGTEPVAVTATISGLEVDETYHFRLRAENQFGTGLGSDQSFQAIEAVFGFQLSGPNKLEMLVSESADPKEPAGGNPAKLD